MIRGAGWEQRRIYRNGYGELIWLRPLWFANIFGGHWLSRVGGINWMPPIWRKGPRRWRWLHDNSRVPGLQRHYPARDCDEFVIRVYMKKRWTPHFLAMLKTMQQYGNLGCSRVLSFYADGDGDFRPTFYWDPRLSSDAKPAREHNGDRMWDAG